MKQVLVLGGGKIGQLIAVSLAQTGDYAVYVGDIKPADLNIEAQQKGTLQFITLDATAPSAITTTIQKYAIGTIISALPFYLNEKIAEIALENHCHYFDLTEDTTVAAHIRRKAKTSTQTIAPQCGLAPGYISILAKDLMADFSKIDAVCMRVGALPQQAHHALKYALTWSTEGLINEYANPCFGIVQGKMATLQPLQDLETIELEGALYEAFNTSGGLGSLADSCQGIVKTMNYKTLRYPGHCEKMRFLMHDLKLIEDRVTLRRLLEKALPTTQQDMVIVYLSVSGFQQDHFFEKTVCKKYYPKTIAGLSWSAIQVTSSAALCAIVDIVLNNPKAYKGVLMQENIPLGCFLENRFGQYFA